MSAWARPALLAEEETHVDGHRSILIAAGYVAMKCKNWPLAVQRWAHIRSIAPDTQDAWVHGITSLRQVGDTAAADALQAQAVAALPTNLAVLSQHAYTAMDRKDWDAALVRWRRVAAVLSRNRATETNIAALLVRVKG